MARLLIATAALLFFAPPLALAKPLRCGTVTYYDDGAPVGDPLPEVAWVGGLGTKRITCCAVDTRWVTDWPVFDYFGLPAIVNARCALGKRRPVRFVFRISPDGGGAFQSRRGSCALVANAGTAGAVQGAIVACKHRSQGFTLSSVGGAFVRGN